MTDNFDWRLEDMGRVSSGPAAGKRILLISMAKHKKYKTLSFFTPNAAALALNVGLNAGAMAESLRPSFKMKQITTPSGKPGFQVREECIPNLYTFFEQAMIASTMSFQALELFSNAIIGRRAKGTISIQRKKGLQDLSPDEAERVLSTEEKLGTVVPNLMGVTSPKGGKVWSRFEALKDVRDRTVHMKSTGMYSNYSRLDRDSLFFVYLNCNNLQHADDAIKTIGHFYGAKPPSWLSATVDTAKRLSVIR